MLRDVAHCTRPCAGETDNGDAVFVYANEERALLAVVDALGHGPKAAQGARKALACLAELAREEELLTIVQGVHGALRGERGAAMTVLLLTREKLLGCAVGNVGLKTLGFNFDLVMSPGVLGSRVRKLRVMEVARPMRGRVALFTDGLSTRFSLEPVRAQPVETACRTLFAEHAKSTDDATLLMADL